MFVILSEAKRSGAESKDLRFQPSRRLHER
jgi:hypothetical protein